MAKVEEIIFNLAEPLVEENGLELIDVEFVKEGSEWFLRLFIDKDDEEGVNLDHCEKISRIISNKLDDNDPINNAYHLEVSSPGIERPLKRTQDFVRFRGEKVQIKTYIPVSGSKIFIGQLEDASDEQVVINTDKGNIAIPRDKISKANLVWEGKF